MTRELLRKHFGAPRPAPKVMVTVQLEHRDTGAVLCRRAHVSDRPEVVEELAWPAAGGGVDTIAYLNPENLRVRAWAEIVQP